MEEAAILAGQADALAESASLARLKADMEIIDASRRAVEKALGSERFADHGERGSRMTWGELPLVPTG